MTFQIRRPTASALAASLCIAGLTAGCSSVGDALSGDKVDYRNTGAKTVKLDVPPDLSQLPGQMRYSQVGSLSTVSANALGSPQTGAAAAGKAQVSGIALTEAGAVKLQREGQIRWLSVAMPPEQVWAAAQGFWTDQGFDLQIEDAKAGLIETNYLENRAKVANDGVLRNAIGRALSFLYDSGTRDQYRMRIERTATGCDIYIAHHGLIEEYETAQKDRTVWRGRPSDPQLEAAMLSRLLVKLGLPKGDADTVTADAAKPVPATAVSSYAKLNADKVSLSVDADLDTTWRRVGLALDRSGFTVEARDRKQGAFDIRLSDSDVEAKRPGFFARMFGAKADGDGLNRFRIVVQSQAGSSKQSQVQVLSDTAKAVSENATARRVAQQILDELN